MQTIIEKSTKESLYLFEDSKFLELNENGLHVGEPIEFRDGWINSSTGELITGVTEPTGWYGRRYKYDGGEWINNHPTGDGKTYSWNDERGRWLANE